MCLFFSCLRVAQRIWPIQIPLQPLLLLTIEIIKLNGAVMVSTKALLLGKSCSCSCGAPAWGDVLRRTKTSRLWCHFKTCHMLWDKCESLRWLEKDSEGLLKREDTSRARCYPVVVTNWVGFSYLYTRCGSHLLLVLLNIKYITWMYLMKHHSRMICWELCLHWKRLVPVSIAWGFLHIISEWLKAERPTVQWMNNSAYTLFLNGKA